MIKEFILIIGLTLSVGILSTSGYNALAEEQPNILADDIKTKMNIDITDNKDTPVISKEVAIENAKKAFPELASVNNIKTQLNKMTYKGLTLFSEEAIKKNPRLKTNGYLENDPVWIVSFKGLKIRPSGPAGTPDVDKEKRVHQEENVVVDALTGETLFSFTFR